MIDNLYMSTSNVYNLPKFVDSVYALSWFRFIKKCINRHISYTYFIFIFILLFKILKFIPNYGIFTIEYEWNAKIASSYPFSNNPQRLWKGGHENLAISYLEAHEMTPSMGILFVSRWKTGIGFHPCCVIQIQPCWHPNPIKPILFDI